MGWKQAGRGLACILALVGCATGGIAHGQELHLNGPEYDVLLTINGLPFHGSLAREDAAGGWKLTVEGTGQDTVQFSGVTLQRDWNVSMDLSKEGLTSDPNGRYMGDMRLDVTYDMQPFDQAAFSLVLQARGDGTDFDAQDVQGWFSHDESIPSQITCQWSNTDFSMYISGLSQLEPQVERSMRHTLSYLPFTITLKMDHKLYYDLPGQGERYIYTILPSLEEKTISVWLAEYIGENVPALPKEPVLKLDLEYMLNALAYAQVDLIIQQVPPF